MSTKQDLIAERDALNVRIHVLFDFINGPDFEQTETDQKAPMTRQLAIMQQLSTVLQERINVLKP